MPTPLIQFDADVYRADCVAAVTTDGEREVSIHLAFQSEPFDYEFDTKMIADEKVKQFVKDWLQAITS